ncbi:GNAT family N-acetyltransferase [Natrialbaceae archaeon A-arb3/5]
MNPDLTIEPATADDIDAIAELWVRLARDQRDHDSHIYPEENRETMREALAAHRVGDGLLVARLADEVVGFASFSIERGSLELDATRGTLSNLYVEPAFRDHGIGTALLDAVEDAFAARGVDVLSLEVMAANDDAVRFYRRHGYETVRITMERPLDDRSENDTHSKEDR